MVVKKKSKPKVKAGKLVTGEMTIMEVMRSRPDSVEKLLNMGMGCCGCHFAMMETLEQGCAAHGLDIKKVLAELNKK
ncbi:MAG: DUF1858 domain-containing protein [archaeon]